MTVRAIRLENFMAFADTGWIELRPISLLFGRNSSGKSAVIRALRLLKQSRDQPPDAPLTRFPLNFFSEHGLDQGRFENTVNRRILDVAEREQYPPLANPLQRIVTFHLRCGLTGISNDLLALTERYLENTDQKAIIPDETRDPLWVDLSLGFARSYNDNRKDWQVELVRIEVSCSWLMSTAEPLVVFLAERTGREDIKDEPENQQWWWPQKWYGPYSDLLFDDDWVVTSDEPADLFSLPSIGFLATLHTPIGLLWEDSVTRQSAGTAFVITLLAEMSSVIYEFLGDMQYLGPIRPEPERLYRFNAIDAAAWRERGWGSYLDFLSLKMPDTSLIDRIDEWFDRLDLGPVVQPEARELGLGFLAQVSVFEEQDGTPFNLHDVGFGASQVLPILVHSLTARSGNFIIIEQPELHLHPKAQARLGDLFIQMSQRGVRFLLETHSEHLLLRFQRRIAETLYEKAKEDSNEPPRNKGYALTSESSLLLYIARANGQSWIESIWFNRCGQLVNPSMEFQDFFDQDYKDVSFLNQATADIIRLKSENECNS